MFKNAPQKRAFHPLQSNTVSVIVNGNGWDMMFSGMNMKNKYITVDLRSLEYKNYVVLSSQLDQINNSKEINQEIKGFNPDTLYFDFSNRREKRIPIKLLSVIKYKGQHFQSGNIHLEPAYVVINGPSKIIDSISQWQTDTLKLDSISQTVSTQVGLKQVEEGNVSIYPKNVEVTIPVDEYTEKTLSVPVKIINDNYGEVKIFPQKVKITFTTSLSRYAEIDEDLFDATADLSLWHSRGYNALPVVLDKIPPFCKIVTITPRYIDFIIKNNAENRYNR